MPDTATTAIYTLSLHDALPIFGESIADLGGLAIAYAAYEKSLAGKPRPPDRDGFTPEQRFFVRRVGDRKSTRLNSSHVSISYAVFCLKKKIYTNITLTFASDFE